MLPDGQGAGSPVAMTCLSTCESMWERDLPDIHNQMHMIRHEHPGLELKLSSMVVLKYPFHNLGYFGVPQPGVAITSIQPGFKFASFGGIIGFAKDRFPFHSPGDWK